MNLFAKLALARQIAQAEQTILRLLGGIETGVATGRTARSPGNPYNRAGAGPSRFDSRGFPQVRPRTGLGAGRPTLGDRPARPLP